MKKRYIAGGIAATLIIGGAVAAYNILPTTHEGSPSELPELAKFGESIGTQVENIALGPRSVVETSSLVTGNLGSEERILRVRFWYPSQTGEGEKANYAHDIVVGGNDPVAVNFAGQAIVDAPAQAGSYPLVVMSHGFGAWAEHYSDLGEHIASRGYIVASIDHGDERVTGLPSFLTSFSNVLQNRTLDQRQVIDAIIANKASQNSGFYSAIDTDKIALLGYSMGGFGALNSAGADYDFSAESLGNLPDTAQTTLQNGTKSASPLSALIAIAPWGGTADNRSWSADSLSKITVPSLFIAGNQDDVSDYEGGISWIFDSMKNSDRHFLTYREARHNVVGNAILDAKFPANDDFATLEYMREPVWRTERLNAINQHFITAFLDFTLKGDADKASYLNPPTQDSNNSKWEVAFGEQLNGTRAGKDQASHWRGFQRRWALGMEMKHKNRGE